MTLVKTSKLRALIREVTGADVTEAAVHAMAGVLETEAIRLSRLMEKRRSSEENMRAEHGMRWSPRLDARHLPLDARPLVSETHATIVGETTIRRGVKNGIEVT